MPIFESRNFKRIGDAMTPSQAFQYDVQKIRAAIFPATLYFFDELDSTNSFSLEAAKSGRLLTPSLTLVRTQTKGRGRMARNWYSEAGNIALTWSIKIEVPLAKLALALQTLPLNVAMIVADALETVAPRLQVQIKWPNDLIVSDCKVGGILIETSSSLDSTTICIGIGLNVNKSIQMPADEVTRFGLKPDYLAHILNCNVGLDEVTIAIANRLATGLADIETKSVDVSNFRKRLWAVGEGVEIDSANASHSGRLEGVKADGSIVISNANGEFVEFRNGTLRRKIP